MKRRRHTPEQVIRKLREADRLLAEGRTTVEVARQLEVSENTYRPMLRPSIDCLLRWLIETVRRRRSGTRQ